MTRLRAAALAVVMLLAANLAMAQATTAVSPVPEPYTKDEFPSWATGLRRFEVVSFGTFPIMLFYTRFAFDMKRFIENGFNSTYTPWPFQNEKSYKPTNDEQITSVLTAAGISIAFGAIDALLVFLADRE